MWELDYKGSWASKKWCFWTVVLEKTFESPLYSKYIQLVHPKGNQSWIFIGRTDAEAETPIFWPLDVKIWLIWKDSDSGKDWRHEEKGATEDEMVGWHHWLNGREFWVDFRSWWWIGRPGVLLSMGVTKSWTWLSNWTKLAELKTEQKVPIYFSLIFSHVSISHYDGTFTETRNLKMA